MRMIEGRAWTPARQAAAAWMRRGGGAGARQEAGARPRGSGGAAPRRQGCRAATPAGGAARVSGPPARAAWMRPAAAWMPQALWGARGGPVRPAGPVPFLPSPTPPPPFCPCVEGGQRAWSVSARPKGGGGRCRFGGVAGRP